ncbi:MAG: c-type cytochrome biogenesis protein CcmI [Phenylobacterium sp.]
MIAFWAAAGLLSAATAILLLVRAGRAAGQAPADTSQLFYRRQLAEIGDLADRGLLGASERKGAEAEAGRRLLAAADAPAAAWSGEGHRNLVLAAAIAAPALAVALYLGLGAPGRADQPFAGRLAQWRAADPQTLAPQEMAAVLGALVKERPNDPEGYRFLALANGASDNPGQAVQALKRGLRIAPDRADLWEMLGEALVYENGGKVTAEAEEAFGQALKRDPQNVAARFNLARAAIARGDKAGGLTGLRAISARLAPGDPRAAALNAAIAEAEGAPAPSAAPPGLSADQMTAVRGMVASLAQRLAAKPDDPEGWVRLVRAYAVLGDAARRDAALKDANARYAARPGVLSQLKDAAAAPPMQGVSAQRGSAQTEPAR